MTEDHGPPVHPLLNQRVVLSEAGRAAHIDRKGSDRGLVVGVASGATIALWVLRDGIKKARRYDPAFWEPETKE